MESHLQRGSTDVDRLCDLLRQVHPEYKRKPLSAFKQQVNKVVKCYRDAGGTYLLNYINEDTPTYFQEMPAVGVKVEVGLPKNASGNEKRVASN